MPNDSTVDTNSTETCVAHQMMYLEFKLIFVGCIGSSLALLSFLENALLFYTFVTSRVLRKRNLIYLTGVSLCDIFISLSYIGIMSMQVYAEYFNYFPLFKLWHDWLRVAFTISHITLSSASFLLVAATFERYLQTIRYPNCDQVLEFVCKNRPFYFCMAFLLGIVFRGTVFFEIEIVHYPECTGLASMGVQLSALAKDTIFESLWRFWARRIFTIFLPFFVLAYCNAAIVYSVQKSEKDRMVKTLILYVTVGSKGHVGRVKSRVRAATRMLVMVVACYLCANILDVFVATWEYIDGDSLLEHAGFYAIVTDVSSLLSILAAALRLPIYISNDKAITREVKAVVCQFADWCSLTCQIPLISKNREGKQKKRKWHKKSFEQPLHLFDDHKRLISDENNRVVVNNGIVSLIYARASVTSAPMSDKLAVNIKPTSHHVALLSDMSPRHVATATEQAQNIAPVCVEPHLISQEEVINSRAVPKERIHSTPTPDIQSWCKNI
uniref:G_PROTEIN_RECEP_F1_2 domain-containing protein n=1 Tax=Steinernema glaseri TaxID=37863 RepID=A0A1I7YLS0_9BILA